jgi:hypothetical protein
MGKRESEAAALLGRLGGLKGGKARVAAMSAEELQAWAKSAGAKGGKARAKTITPERARQIAKKAAAARWKKSAKSK